MPSEQISFSEFLPVTGKIQSVDLLPLESFAELARKFLSEKARTDQEVADLVKVLNTMLSEQAAMNPYLSKSVLRGFLSLMNRYHDKTDDLLGFYWYECIAIALLSTINSALVWSKQSNPQSLLNDIKVQLESSEYLEKLGEFMNLMGYTYKVSKLGSMSTKLLELNFNFSKQTTLTQNASQAAVKRHEASNRLKAIITLEYERGFVSSRKWKSMKNAAHILFNNHVKGSGLLSDTNGEDTVYEWIRHHVKSKSS